MRKLVLVILATLFLTTGARADVYYISSDINDGDVGLFMSITNMLYYTLRDDDTKFGFAENFSLGGYVIDADNDGMIDDGGRITLFGTMTFHHIYAGHDARVTLNMAGRYVNGVNEGVLFDEGKFLVEIRNEKLEWELVEIVDVAHQPLSFLETGDNLVLNPVIPDQTNIVHVIPFLAARDFSDILFSEITILGVTFDYGFTFGGDIILQTP